ncbi:uncharacterized protein VTP21DRAFT_2883 [Calcarisporiella thermophila]|uniref:uncharacterized protein n=1 Tax=Calcarisporiella thermophila TaxID=911321 RepID=UPI003743EFC2
MLSSYTLILLLLIISSCTTASPLSPRQTLTRHKSCKNVLLHLSVYRSPNYQDWVDTYYSLAQNECSNFQNMFTRIQSYTTVKDLRVRFYSRWDCSGREVYENVGSVESLNITAASFRVNCKQGIREEEEGEENQQQLQLQQQQEPEEEAEEGEEEEEREGEDTKKEK